MKKDERGENVEIFDKNSILTLITDEGEVDFFEIAAVDYEGKFYALLQPVEPVDGLDEDEVLIFERQEGDGGPETDMFSLVADEKLLEKVFEEYIRKFADEETEE